MSRPAHELGSDESQLVGGLLPKIGLQPISQPFDMITMLGFLILVGTVVNNPILVVEQARQNLCQQGTDAVAAVVAAIQPRLRPIAMTTLTTICGLSPLVFLPGEGTELYRGVGAIVLFGLMGAIMVTVTFLPALTVFVLGGGRRVTGGGEAEPFFRKSKTRCAQTTIPCRKAPPAPPLLTLANRGGDGFVALRQGNSVPVVSDGMREQGCLARAWPCGFC